VNMSTIDRQSLRVPRLPERLLEDHPQMRRRPVPGRLHLPLKLGIGLLIIVLLWGVVWVETVVSRHLVT
jgi:hypothetical protein